jgi:hypothetical protein
MINRMMGRRSLGLCILFIFLVAFPTVSHALCEVTLQWNSDPSTCEGYYVFGREDGQDYNYMEPWWYGDSSFSACTFDDLDESKTYHFVIRAYAGDNESADSNEVSFATTKIDQTNTTSPSSGDSSANDDSVNSDPPTGSDDPAANNSNSAALSSGETSSSAGGTPHKSSWPCFISSLYNFD